MARTKPPVSRRRSGAVRYGQVAAEHAASRFSCGAEKTARYGASIHSSAAVRYGQVVPPPVTGRSHRRPLRAGGKRTCSVRILLSIRQEVLEVARRAPPVTGRGCGAVRYGQVAREHAVSSNSSSSSSSSKNRSTSSNSSSNSSSSSSSSRRSGSINNGSGSVVMVRV